MTLHEIFNIVKFEDVWEILLRYDPKKAQSENAERRSFRIYQTTIPNEDDCKAIVFTPNTTVGAVSKHDIHTAESDLRTIMSRQVIIKGDDSTITNEGIAAMILEKGHNLVKLDCMTHIRIRPGMYIGEPGNGNSPDDGIYTMVRNMVNYFNENIQLDNHITLEIRNKQIIISTDNQYIPFGVLDHYVDANLWDNMDINEIYFKTDVALCEKLVIESRNGGWTKRIIASRGVVISNEILPDPDNYTSLKIEMVPDEVFFEDYTFKGEILSEILKEYAYCNPGVSYSLITDKNTINPVYCKPEGMLDLVEDYYNLYPVPGAIHIKTDIMDVAIAPAPEVGKGMIRSFVNGLPTTQHGTHVRALSNIIFQILNGFDSLYTLPQNIFASLAIALNIYIEDPIFESCIKVKLGSRDISTKPNVSIQSYMDVNIAPMLKNLFWKHNNIYNFLTKMIRNPDSELIKKDYEKARRDTE